jgi:predicted DNA-binding transcriptional regulator YafY
LQTATATLAATGPTIDPEVLTAIAGACRDHERLRFAYRGREEASRRLVEPHSLVNLGRRWYLVAWDCERADWRTFRVDRLERPSPAGARFAPRELPHEDAAAYVAENRSSSAMLRHQARLTLHAPAETIARLPYVWGDVEPIDERSCSYRTGDDSLDWLAVRVAMLGVDFEVHEPTELAARCRAMADRLARAGGALAAA